MDYIVALRVIRPKGTSEFQVGPRVGCSMERVGRVDPAVILDLGIAVRRGIGGPFRKAFGCEKRLDNLETQGGRACADIIMSRLFYDNQDFLSVSRRL